MQTAGFFAVFLFNFKFFLVHLREWVVPREVSNSCYRKTQNEVAAVIPEPDESFTHFPYRVSFPNCQRPPKINFVRLRSNRASRKLYYAGPWRFGNDTRWGKCLENSSGSGMTEVTSFCVFRWHEFDTFRGTTRIFNFVIVSFILSC